MNDEFEHNDNESYESDDTNTEDTYSNTESDLSDTINTTNENNNWDEDDAYLKTFVCENHFSDESVHERVSKLNTYKVQMKLLKILNDEGACPKLFDIVMEWVNEYFEIKPNVCPPQRFRTRDTLMRKLKNTYSEFSGGSIKTEKLNVNDVSCLSHCCCF